MTIEERQHINVKDYQIARRRMCYVALSMMVVATIAVIVDPVRMAYADAQMMMMYGSLSALVGAFFAVGHKEV